MGPEQGGAQGAGEVVIIGILSDTHDRVAASASDQVSAKCIVGAVESGSLECLYKNLPSRAHRSAV